MTAEAIEGAIIVRWTWPLRSSPQALWPLISDTDRLNELVGLAPVRQVGTDGARRIVRSRLEGWPVEWIEEPFDWIYGRQLSVRRVFKGGPLSQYRFALLLSPAGEGTRLELRLDLRPRNPLLKPFLKLVTAGQHGAWSRAFRRIDDQASEPPSEPNAPGPLTPELEALVARLAQIGHVRDRVVRLVRHVVSGPASQAARIQPYALADRWGESRAALLDLCVDAAAMGLLELRWSLLCPHCRGPKLTVAHLADLRRTATCDACAVDFSGTFDQSVELSFAPSPAIRTGTAPVFCVGSPGRTPHVVFQDTLEPGSERELVLDVPSGAYRLRAQGLENALWCDFERSERDGDPVSIALGALGGEIAVEGAALNLLLKHGGERPVRIVVEEATWSSDVVTAAFISSHAGFRRRFGHEAMAAGVHLPTRLMAFVALCARGIADRCRDLGVDRAAEQAQALWELATGEIAGRRGTLVSKTGDLALCAFYDPLDAFEAAAAIAALPVSREEGIALSVGLDAGPCLAIEDQGQLGYFGPCVSRAIEAARLGRPGELVLTRPLSADPSIHMALGGRPDLSPLESDYVVMSAG